MRNPEQDPPSSAPPRFLNHRNYETISVCCFHPSFLGGGWGDICYAATDNRYTSSTVKKSSRGLFSTTWLLVHTANTEHSSLHGNCTFVCPSSPKAPHPDPQPSNTLSSLSLPAFPSCPSQGWLLSPFTSVTTHQSPGPPCHLSSCTSL